MQQEGTEVPAHWRCGSNMPLSLITQRGNIPRMHLWRIKPETLGFYFWQESTLQSTVNDFMGTGLHWQVSMHALSPSAFSRLLKKPRVRSSERLGMESSKGKVPPGESRVWTCAFTTLTKCRKTTMETTSLFQVAVIHLLVPWVACDGASGLTAWSYLIMCI